jgi:hypothetical protein
MMMTTCWMGVGKAAFDIGSLVATGVETTPEPQPAATAVIARPSDSRRWMPRRSRSIKTLRSLIGTGVGMDYESTIRRGLSLPLLRKAID